MELFEGYDNIQDTEYEQMMHFIIGHEGPQAKLIGDWLEGYILPCSVIDIGCGPGVYLLPFRRIAPVDIYGIDACKTAGILLNEDEFERVDLRFPYIPIKKYDLALCLEVVEHLEEKYADTLIDTICKCSDTVLFTGAVENQGGTFHVNEKPHSYWLNKFKLKGYGLHRLHQTFRNYMNSLPDAYEGMNVPYDAPYGVTGWMKNNSFLLQKDNSIIG